jgi:citrate synthase
VVRALNTLLILHVDHEQNCSTTAVRLVASARANLYAAVSAGICALWGPLHGGANQAVIEMLKRIRNDHRNVKKYVAKAKDKNDSFRLMGFGHAVYKNYDPRAKIIKEVTDKLLEKLQVSDPLLDVAKELEQVALNDEYFIERRLYPNVDFYSGIAYRAMGFPTNMLTVLFTIGRLPGWIAHWKEGVEAPGARIMRPRQVYTGPEQCRFVPIRKRKKNVRASPGIPGGMA